MDKVENLKSQLTEIYEWMRETADVSYKQYSLENMIEDCRECYEVTLHVYLKDTQAPILFSNRCTEGYLRGIRICDEIIIFSEGFGFSKHDYNYSYGFIPYSNISYIEAVSHTDVWESEELRKAYEEKLKHNQ